MSVIDIIKENDVINSYRILEKIGEGNGVVYRARRLGSEVDLAVKFAEAVISRLGLDLKYTMENERRIHKALGSHPKVAGIVDAFDVDRGVMLLANVYELVPAVPTDELVSGTRGVRELITMGYDIAEAFDHTHGKRIIHRDMKPANVLVDKNTGRAKLADFGIAAFASELPSIRDPIWGTPIGSARYMSPEQICRQNISYPSDIYSFGAAMYHMLTGEVPVDGKEITDIYYNLQAGNVNRTVSRPDVPEELEWALESLVKAIKDLRQGNKNHRPDAKEALNWFDVLKHDLAA